ncbi:MAG TPA: hypothetical protein VGK87_04725 [Anaerolineae bacterium]|jgi:hypothetical protein
MDVWYYAIVYCLHSQVQRTISLLCTDTSEVGAMYDYLKASYPKAQYIQRKLPTGELLGFLADKMNWQEEIALWQVIYQLCSRGWEPLGIASDVQLGGSHTEFVYQFRRKR